jgi:hypothetical protein
MLLGQVLLKFGAVASGEMAADFENPFILPPPNWLAPWLEAAGKSARLALAIRGLARVGPYHRAGVLALPIDVTGWLRFH